MNIRDQAVMLLNALGSRQSHPEWQTFTFFNLANELDVSDAAMSLARSAYDAIPSMMHRATVQTVGEPFAHELECLEAALLLESGWLENDPIVMMDGELVQPIDPFQTEDVETYDEDTN